MSLAAISLPFLLSQSSTPPPNILFILADDWGYGAAGCYGNPYIRTPNIDTLASQGLRFTQAYSPAPVCSPTRWSLMTGQHVGYSETATNSATLYPDQITIAHQMKAIGYRTGLIGKWGIEGLTPNQAGFDTFLGYLSNREAWEFYPGWLWEQEEQIPIPAGTYTPDLFTSRAIEWMNQPGSPFFLYFPVNLPHANGNLRLPHAFQIPADYQPYAGQPWTQTERNYAACHTYLDDLVGQLVAALPPNTLVIFTSDNGPDDFFPEPLLETAGGLRGEKATLYEAGIRVSLIISGPGITPGVETRPAWLVNFWQVALSGDVSRFIEPGPMYWSYEHFGRELVEAVRIGDFKGLRIGETWELYDLANDPGETTNLAGAYPDVIWRMGGVMDSYCPAPKVCRGYLPWLQY